MYLSSPFRAWHLCKYTNIFYSYGTKSVQLNWMLYRWHNALWEAITDKPLSITTYRFFQSIKPSSCDYIKHSCVVSEINWFTDLFPKSSLSELLVRTLRVVGLLRLYIGSSLQEEACKNKPFVKPHWKSTMTSVNFQTCQLYKTYKPNGRKTKSMASLQIPDTTKG